MKEIILLLTTDNENVTEKNLLTVNNECENNESVEVENNVIEIEENVTIKGKKRVANPVLWKKNIAKVMRAEGKEHISLRKKVVQPRKTGPPCTCKMECFKNITDEQKVLLLKLFNDIGEKTGYVFS